MQVSSVHSIPMKGSVANNTATTNPQEKKDVKEIIKDNKGKIALALGALAAAGVAAVALTRGKKVPSEMSIDDFKKIGKFEKGAATVNGKPYTGVINVTNKKGTYALEYADGALKSSTLGKSVEGTGSLDIKLPLSKKVYSTNDGVRTVEEFDYVHGTRRNEKGEPIGGFEWLPTRKTTVSDGKVVKEHKDGYFGETLADTVERQQDGTWKKTFQKRLWDNEFENKKYARSYIVTMDEAGNTIAKSNPVYKRMDVIGPSNEPVLRQSKKYINDDGNEVVATYVNNHIRAVKTTKLHNDGSKQIIVEYPSYNGMIDDVTKTIDIAKDGTKKVNVTGGDLV